MWEASWRWTRRTPSAGSAAPLTLWSPSSFTTETFYTELLTAFDIVGVIDCCVGEGSCALACAYLGIAYKATLGKTHVAELHWLPRCCSDKDASILVAPDFDAKKRRQRYAYLGGGQFERCLDDALGEHRGEGQVVGGVVAAAALCSAGQLRMGTGWCHAPTSGSPRTIVGRRGD